MFEAEQISEYDHQRYYMDIETIHGDWMHWGHYNSLENVLRTATNTLQSYKKDFSLSGSFKIKKLT